MNKPVAGFSKLSKKKKISWIAKEYPPSEAIALLKTTIGIQMKNTETA
jgi:hypothetical protein